MIRWHRAKAWDAYPYWYAELDGVRMAEAVNTSQTQTENYPTFGVADTLGSIKQLVAYQLGQDVR